MRKRTVCERVHWLQETYNVAPHTGLAEGGLIWFVLFIWLIWFICFVSFNQKTKQTKQTKSTGRACGLLPHPAIARGIDRQREVVLCEA